MKRLTRLLLVIGGTAAVALGIVGVFVPLLPTTPFLLLAAFLYARSSERFYKWLLGSRWVGDYIGRYYERRSMTRRHKALTLMLLWVVMGLSAAFVVDVWWARLLLSVVALGVTAHLLWIPSE
jgi:uncharacterized membrane protein YbaN (DUF454 family)